MRIVRGPFILRWNGNDIEDVEEIGLDFEQSSDDYETVQGKTFEIDGPQKVGVTLTLLRTDIPVLAVLLPQYFVPNGGIMSTGETVNNADGAIDVKPRDCDDDLIYGDLDIVSCGNPAQVTRIVNARTKLDGVDFDNKLQKVTVRFVGESEADEATLQFFRENTINVVS